MQLFKKNSIPDLVLFKKVSNAKNFGKKKSYNNKKEILNTNEKEEPTKKKYHLEKPI